MSRDIKKEMAEREARWIKRSQQPANTMSAEPAPAPAAPEERKRSGLIRRLVHKSGDALKGMGQ